ncbi:hypothetical protein PFISCL1PPCAC_6517, partial [Pristionchus fissidentatus]
VNKTLLFLPCRSTLPLSSLRNSLLTKLKNPSRRCELISDLLQRLNRAEIFFTSFNKRCYNTEIRFWRVV